MDIELETTVSGIPCISRVTDANYTQPDRNTWSSDIDYRGGWEIEWELLDQRGRPAAWLERKATAGDRERIEAELIEQLGATA